ncbi:MAG: BrnT family toxin [Myxococcales bacterium]|nr:BrnT family toxin [Myxococcales bacterium]
MRFEWDNQKAERNVRKHGITFTNAATAFGDPLSLTIPDPQSLVSEERYLIIGAMAVSGLVVVSFTERGDSVRIISARRPTRTEVRAYEDEG